MIRTGDDVPVGVRVNELQKGWVLPEHILNVHRIDLHLFVTQRAGQDQHRFCVLNEAGHGPRRIVRRLDGELRDGELLLVDAGAEYKGYASDITRTYPINGRFSQAQREIYDLVLKAQMSCVEMVRPGVTHDQLKQHSIEVLTEGMVELGLLRGKPEDIIKEKQYEKFYMHGLGHMLGIDVHDCANARSEKYRKGTIDEGYVFTIEPGLYFQTEDELVPEELRGIGIRIEDDIWCTAEGAVNLSAGLPRGADEVESWLAAQRASDNGRALLRRAALDFR